MGTDPNVQGGASQSTGSTQAQTERYSTYEEAGHGILSRPPINDTISEQGTGGEPEPQETQALDDGFGEEAPAEGQETAEVAQEAEVEETDLLPNEQEREYPDSVYERYAKRFGKTLEDVKADESFRQLLKAKIDSDVYVKSLEEKMRAATEAPQLENQEDETENVPQETKTPEQVQAEFFTQLDKIAEQVTDQKMAETFMSDLVRAYGAEPTPEDMKNAMAVTKAFTKGALNLMNTVVPQMVNSMISQAMEQHFPGFGETWERSTYQRAWDSVKTSDKRYATLPDYNSPKFTEMIQKVVKAHPEFERLQFTDKAGKPLSRYENAMAQYRLAASIASNQQVTPTEVRQAVQKGKQLQQQVDKSKTVAKITSAGQPRQSNGQFAPAGKKGVGSGLGIIEAWNSRHHPD
jgi:hypothetical protein